MTTRPMQATLTEGVTSDEGYTCEIKWDGYRIMSFVNKGKVRLASRGGKDYTARYPPVADALKSLKHDILLDTKSAVIHWVKPEPVANFDYAEMTETGRIRKAATWKGFLLDKKAMQVILPIDKALSGLSSSSSRRILKDCHYLNKSGPGAKNI